jgi:glycosyltransferase involved in cell wall biosynthesis
MMQDNHLKLLVITHYYPQHRGGVEIVAGQLVLFLSDRQDTDIIWIASDTDPAPPNHPLVRYLPITTLNIIEKLLHFAYPLWNPLIYRKLYRQIQQIDIVHLHEFIYVGNILAFIIAKQLKKPVVITQHIGFIAYSSFVLRIVLQLVNKTLGRWMLKNADQVIFCSKVIQSYWLDFEFQFRKTPVLIPNGVDTQIFVPVSPLQRQQIRDNLGYGSDRLLILFVGRFVEKKGLHIIHALATQYLKIDWGFAGWGPIDPDDWGLPNVRVFRDRQGAQLTPLYQAADLLILPSLGEAFPLVIQEAMACGTPTFISRESADQYPEISHLLFSEEVDVGDVIECWSNTIKTLQQNPQKLANMRAEVANFAQQHWSWVTCADQYHQIYQEVAVSEQ